MSTTSPLILDYAPRRPRRSMRLAARRLARGAILAAFATLRWSWRNRHHLSGVLAAAGAAFVVYLSFDARVVLSTPVFGGCGTQRQHAYAQLWLSGLALFALPPLWWAARRSRWSARLARTALLIALVWWVYVRYPTHGHRLWLGA